VPPATDQDNVFFLAQNRLHVLFNLITRSGTRSRLVWVVFLWESFEIPSC